MVLGLSPRQAVRVMVALTLLRPVVDTGLAWQTVRVVEGLLVPLQTVQAVVEYLSARLERDDTVLGGKVGGPKGGATLGGGIPRVGGRLGEVALPGGSA